MMRAVALAVVCAVPLTATAEVVWRGDFETGNLSQWDRVQRVSSDRLQVIKAPAREGSYALKTLVRRGDDPIDASGNRNELIYLSQDPEGSEYFYKWSTMFAKSFPSANTWQIFAQFHHDGCCGSPPVEFLAIGETLQLKVGGETGTVVWTAPLEREVWHDFIFHVRWSSSAKTGFVELYHKGKLVLPRRAAATLYPGMRNYLKLGLYRNSTVTPDGVVFHDGAMKSTTLEDMLPPPSPAAPPPSEPAPEPDLSSPPLAQLDVGTTTPDLRGCAAVGSGPLALGALVAAALWLTRAGRRAVFIRPAHFRGRRMRSRTLPAHERYLEIRSRVPPGGAPSRQPQ